MGNGTKHGAGRKKHSEHSAQRARHGGKSRKSTEHKKEHTSKARNRNNNNNNNSGSVSPCKRQGNHTNTNSNAASGNSVTLTERVAEVWRAELPETHPALHIPSPVIAQRKTQPAIRTTSAATATNNTTTTITTSTNSNNSTSAAVAAQAELLRAVRASVLQAAASNNNNNSTTSNAASLRSPSHGGNRSDATKAAAGPVRSSPARLSRGVTTPPSHVNNNSNNNNQYPNNHANTGSTGSNNVCTPAPVLGSSNSTTTTAVGGSAPRQTRRSPPLTTTTTTTTTSTTSAAHCTHTRTVYKAQPPSLFTTKGTTQQPQQQQPQAKEANKATGSIVPAHEMASHLTAQAALRNDVVAEAEDSASLNSSFSETAQSATRTASCRSYILPARAAEGNAQTQNNNTNEEEDEDDEADSIYDEEDEEQAVQQYMDSWVAPTRPRSGHTAAATTNTAPTAEHTSTAADTVPVRTLGEGERDGKAAGGRVGPRAELESDTELQMLLRRRHPITTATLSPLDRGTPSPQVTPPSLPQPAPFSTSLLHQHQQQKGVREGSHASSSSNARVTGTLVESARHSPLELGEIGAAAETLALLLPAPTTVHTRRAALHENTSHASPNSPASSGVTLSGSAAQQQQLQSSPPFISVANDLVGRPSVPAATGSTNTTTGGGGNNNSSSTNSSSGASKSISASQASTAPHAGEGKSDMLCPAETASALPPLPHLIAPTATTTSASASNNAITNNSTSTTTTPAMGCILPLPTELSAEACRQLSLYDCFVLDARRQIWLVDDAVLAKCLEYIRLMEYEHPMLAHDKAAHRPSIWSSSASLPAPLRAMAGDAALPYAACVCSSADGVCRRAARRSTAPVLCSAAVCNVDPLFLEQAEAMRWLVQQEYVIGTLLACCARARPHATSGRHGSATGTAPSLHSTVAQAASEKREDSNSSNNNNNNNRHSVPHPSWKDNNNNNTGNTAPTTNSGNSSVLHTAKPQPACIPAHIHPIHWVAQLVLRKFPQWGDFVAFAQLWESQVRLVLCSASPSHQRSFVATDDGLVFRSDFEGGNLLRVERAVEPYMYYLWLEPDCGSDKRIWFRFSIEGAREGRPLRFRLLNAAPHSKLYCENHMQPVWRDGARQPFWAPVDQCSFRTANNDLDGEVSFAIVPRSSIDTIQVAFCAPYTYADLLCHLCHWHNLLRSSVQSIRFEEKVLCRSPEGRKLHLLIISSYAEKAVHGGHHTSGVTTGHKTASSHVVNNNNTNNTAMAAANNSASNNTSNNANGSSTSTMMNSSTAAGLSVVGHGKQRHSDVVHGPYANFQSGKKVILISGRVHPGEITASHGLHGLISFLLSSDPRAAQLREHFIFFIVPMLNPDGVSRGHSRMDQYGVNLNRCYNEPDPVTQPTVHALRRLFEYLQRVYRENFIMYLDFHSHASKSNAFMFGNCLPRTVQHWNLVFPKLVELHARDLFAFSLCRFTWSGMLSKDGASRVLFGAGLIHSYTIELPHFTDRRLYVDSLRSLNSGRPPCFNEPAGAASSSSSSPSSMLTLTVALSLPPAILAAAAAAAGNVSNTSAVMALTTTSVAAGGGKGGNARHGTTSGGGAAMQAAENAESAAHRADLVQAADKVNTTISGGNPANNSTARRVAHNTQTSKAKPHMHRAASASVATQRTHSTSRLSVRRGRRSVSSSQRPAVSTLREIAQPCVLRQSALVGQACMLALLDYCSLNARFSPELTGYGGMERVLTEVKRQIKKSRAPANGNAVSPTAAMQPIYRQY